MSIERRLQALLPAGWVARAALRRTLALRHWTVVRARTVATAASFVQQVDGGPIWALSSDIVAVAAISWNSQEARL